MTQQQTRAPRPQKHLYQQLICVLEGHGTAEVWLDETARQLAFRPGGSSENPTGFRRSGKRTVNGVPGVYVSYRKGGTLIEYEDEDPRIKLDFERRLAAVGIPSEMPDFEYNRDVY